jgi:hypothetical protein
MLLRLPSSGVREEYSSSESWLSSDWYSCRRVVEAPGPERVDLVIALVSLASGEMCHFLVAQHMHPLIDQIKFAKANAIRIEMGKSPCWKKLGTAASPGINSSMWVT